MKHKNYLKKTVNITSKLITEWKTGTLKLNLKQFQSN